MGAVISEPLHSPLTFEHINWNMILSAMNLNQKTSSVRALCGVVVVTAITLSLFESYLLLKASFLLQCPIVVLFSS